MKTKKTPLEITIMTILGVVFLWWFAMTYLLIKEVNDAGGWKQLIINVGKEVKDIGKQINEND